MTTPSEPAAPFSRQGMLGALRWLLAGFLLFAYGWLNYMRYFPPFVFYIQASVLVLFCIWGGWKVARREQLCRSPLALPMVAFVGAAALATLFSIDPRRSFDGLIVTLVLVLTFFLVGDLLLAGVRPQAFINMLLWLTVLALGAGLWAIIQHHRAMWDLRAPGYPPFLFTYRLFGVFDHPNFLAALLNMAMPFAIVRLAQARGFFSGLLPATWLLVYVVVLFFTRSRGGWVAASTAALTMLVGLSLWHGLPRWSGVGAWLRQNGRTWATALAYGGLFLFLLRGPDLVTLAFTSLTQHEDHPPAQTASSAPSPPAAEEASTEPVRSDYSTNAGSSVAEALQGHRMALWRIAWSDFVEHPLTGNGPLTFGYSFVEEEAAVRFWVPGYAHSLYVEILGTTGIVGALALAWLLLRAGLLWGWALLRGFILSPPAAPREGDRRGVLLAVCAALASYLVHALVDMPGKMPLNDVVAVMLIALGVWAAGALRQPEQGTLARWTAALFVVLLAPGVLLWHQNQAQEAMLNGAAHALASNWEAAAHNLDTAVALDPAFAFYHGQRGYAYSMLAAPIGAAEDPRARQHALASYARSRMLEPPYIPNLLNHAALLDAAGQPQQAEKLLEQAVDLPQSNFWALPALLLADRYAARGQDEAASKLFAAAFASEPHAPQMAACRRSSACRRAAQQLPMAAGELHTRAQALIDAGEPRQALALLEEVPLSSADPLPWIDRAAAHLALRAEAGELAQARYALHVADRLRFANRYTAAAATPAALAHAAYALAHNQPEQAIDALEQAVLPAITRDGYSYGIFRRVGLPGTFSPRLDLLQRTEDDLEVFRLLADLYASQGDADRARWARERAAVLTLLLDDNDTREG